MPSIASKLERLVSGALGSGTDTSKDGNKDASKDTSTNKDGNKDNTTKAGAVTSESGANRGTLENIDTSVSAQNNDLVDLQKGENLNGKQSPTPRNKKGGWQKK